MFVTFNATETQFSVVVVIVDDANLESTNETFSIRAELASFDVTGVSVNPKITTVTIEDNDGKINRAQ